jgi:hypothetical protein
MGLTPNICKKILKYLNDGGDSIIELGCQQFYSLTSSNIQLEELKEYNDGDYVKLFYEKMGLKYDSIDINNSTIVADLNCEIPCIDREYDIVTNLGTSEHIFNQFNVFSFMHRVVKIDGYMIHCIPIKHDKHGFYLYDLNFLISLSYDNEYKLVELTLAIRDKSEEYLFKSIEDVSKSIDDINKSDVCYVFFVVKKQRQAEFVPPKQLIYNDSLSFYDMRNIFGSYFDIAVNVSFGGGISKHILKHVENFDSLVNPHEMVYVYGAGEIGVSIYRYSRFKNRIVGFFDSNSQGNDFFSTINIMDMSDFKYPVYIASSSSYNEIKKQLIFNFPDVLILN